MWVRLLHPGPALRRIARLALVAACLAIGGVLLLRLITVLRYHADVYDPASVPVRPVALVFGAGVWLDGQPTPVLADRVETAAELYRLGKVERLLLTGDGREAALNETAAMRRLALSLGVPDAAIVTDDGGLRTWASCARAHDEFGVTGAILVTQGFHLPRALLLCDHAGIDAVGVDSGLRDYGRRWNLRWEAREVPATAVAWWDVATGW
jgi:vancomycin permeability regulator SanA